MTGSEATVGASLGPSDLVLGIETSCDETAAAVVRGGREIVASVVASQDELHARFGGVVPEIASRRHAEIITATVAEALARAEVSWDELAGIAVTHGPGLVGSLLVGVAAAKGYCLATGLPLVGVNHVEAHLVANFIHAPGEPAAADEGLLPALCLIASGGHSDIVLVANLGAYRIVGWTRDDAAGEALDKAARVLGLGYPGGPAVDRAARAGNPGVFSFPRPVIADSYDFSFSGLKTALLRTVTTLAEARAGDSAGPEVATAVPPGAAGLPAAVVADLAAGFQEAVVDTLVRNLTRAAGVYGTRQVMLAGGVAANSRLRDKLTGWHRASGVAIAFPPLNLCTDNAAMVAAAGFLKAQRSGWDDLELDVFSAMPLADHV